MPLVKGTVDNHKSPINDANSNIVNSVFGKKIKHKKRIPLSEYKRDNKFFLDPWSPKYPNSKVPTILKRPT